MSKNIFIFVLLLLFAYPAIAQTGALSGDYIVGNVVGAHFPTLKAAADCYNTYGITANSRLIISSDITEAQQVEFLGSASGSAGYTLTVTSDGTRRTVSGAINGPLILMTGANNITFDGITAASTSNPLANKLVFANTYPTESSAVNTISILKVNDSNKGRNVTIRNTELSNLISGSSSVANLIATVDSVRIENCYLHGANENVILQMLKRITITGNVIRDAKKTGISMTGYYPEKYTIIGNNIADITATGSGTIRLQGIFLSSAGLGTFTIEDNFVHDITNQSTGMAGAYGIILETDGTLNVNRNRVSNISNASNDMNYSSVGIFCILGQLGAYGGIANLDANTIDNITDWNYPFGIEIFSGQPLARGNLTNNTVTNVIAAADKMSNNAAGIRMNISGSLSNSKVFGVKALSGRAMGVYGYNTNTAPTIYNNMIGDLQGKIMVGIDLEGPNAAYKVYHNSISIKDENGYESSCFVIGKADGSETISADVQNNIFSNEVANGAASNSIYTCYSGSSLSTKNNRYYLANGKMGAYSGTQYATITDWKTVISDNGSYLAKATFVSGNNLHLATYPVGLQVPTISGVAVDIDGDTRTTCNNLAGADNNPSASGVLSGIYTIGDASTCDFTSLKQAVDIYNSCGLSTNTTFKLADDITETQQVEFLGSAPGSTSYTLTITSDGVRRNITGSINGALIKLTGANNITIDGLQAATDATPASPLLSFANTYATASANACALSVDKNGTNSGTSVRVRNAEFMLSQQTTNGSAAVNFTTDNMHIEGCYIHNANIGLYGKEIKDAHIQANIIAANEAQGVYVIPFSSGTTINITQNVVKDMTSTGTSTNMYGIRLHAPSASGQWIVSNNVIKNLNNLGNFENPLNGVHIDGSAEIQFIGNTITDLTCMSPSTGYALKGVTLNSSSGTSIQCKNDTIRNFNSESYAVGIEVRVSTGTAIVQNCLVDNINGKGARSDSYNSAGIYASGQVAMNANTISNIKNTVKMAIGIYASTISSNTINNMISNVIGNPGIGIYAQSGANLYHNSVRLTEKLNDNAEATAISIGDRVGVAIASNVRLQNNILSNEVPNGANQNFLIKLQPGSTLANASASNNRYYISNGSIGMVVSNMTSQTGTSYNTITDWTTASGGDNSTIVEPVFVSANNLHLSGTSLSDKKLLVPLVSGITADMDGDTRTACTNAAGADNNNAIILDIADIAVENACSGDDKTITITATGGTAPYQYSINGSAFAPVSSVSGNNITIQTSLLAGDYTITLKDANSCQDDTSFTATAPIPVTPAISGTNSVCIGAELTLTGNAITENTNIIWSVDGGTITTGQDTNEIKVLWTDAGTKNITLSYQNTLGCTGTSAAYVVTVIAKPTVIVASPTPVCTPATVDVSGTATGAATYKYYADNGSGGVGSELSPTIISSVGATNYWVIGKSVEGCASDPVQGTATIHAKPVITVTSPEVVCAPLTVDVSGTATGAATYKYYADNGGDIGAELSPAIISSAGTTNYWVIGKSAEGCTSEAVMGTVTIHAKPVIRVNSPAAVCAPLTVDVSGTATGAATYKYYTDNTGSVELSPTVISSVGTTNYWVIGTSAEGCVSDAVMGTVVINAKPVITVNSPTAVCAPLTVDVAGTATGAATYKYYADNGGDIGVELSPTIISSVGTTNYWVIGTSAEGCVSEAVMSTVTIHAKPVITVNSPAAVCAPLTVDVSGTASGAATYKYYTDNTGSVELSSTIISNAGTTNYWVIGTSAEGCASEAVQGTVTINAKPVITVNSPAAVCAPLTVDVSGTASGTATYKYYADNGSGGIGSELSPTIISSVGTTNYWVIGTSAENCASDSKMGTVTIHAKPVITVTSPTAVCAPSTIDVSGTATGAATYKYYADNGGNIGSELSPAIISSVGTTNYWVIGTSAEGCASEAVMGTVTINAKPVITVNSPAAVCAPLTVDIAGTATGAATYKYYTDNTGSVELSPTIISSVGTTNYWVIGKSVEGCSSDPVQGTVTINAKPVITVNSPAAVCAPLTVDVAGTATGAATYKYYTDNTGSVELSSTIISSVGTTNYWVIGTSAEGCTSEAVQGTVTIHAKPVITVTSPAAVCAPLTVDVTGTATGAATYKYYADNGGTIGSELNPTIISSVGTTNYWVIGTSAEGCVSEAVMGTVTIHAKPVIRVNSPAAVCAPLTVDVAGTATGAATYKYYTDNTGSVELSPTIISSVGTTNYWAIGTSAEGCSSDPVQGTVTIHAKPIITITSPAAVCAPLTIDVAGTATGAATYKYYTDNTGSVELSATIISSVGTTNYWVIGKSAEGCVSEAVQGAVTINAKPVITVNSPAAVCAPLTVDVSGTATGAATYKYYTDNTGSVELSPTVISSVGTTNYWVIGTSAEGCVSEAVMGTVTIHAKPVITVTSPAAVCAPLTVDVAGTATGAATYKYYADNGGTIGSELSSTVISSVGTTNYWVIGKSAEGCTSEAVQGTVTINAKPVITVTSPAAVCAPLTIDVSGTATGAATYKYYTDNTGSIELSPTVISSVGTTNYWVIGTSAEGCVSEAVQGTVTINAKPIITITSPAAVCAPLTVDVAGTATGAATYKYYTDNTGSVELSPTIISNVGTTKYWVIGTSSQNCISDAVMGTVTINAKPVITVTSPAAVCAPLTVDVAGTATGAATYKYYADNIGAVGSELSSTIISSVGTTNYWVIGTSAQNCVSEAVQGTVTINAKPVIRVNSPAAVCAPLTVDVAGTATGAATYKYYTDNTGSVELSPTIISSVGTTNYWVIGKSTEGCFSDPVQGTVTINAKPVITVTSPAAVCAPLTVDVSGTATGAATYKYYTDNTGSVELNPAVISSVGATNYWVIGTSVEGCVSAAVMGTVTINAKPVITVTSPAAVCTPSTVDVAGTASRAATYKYYADNAGSAGTELLSTVISSVGTTNYWVIGTSVEGCASEAVMGTVTINAKPVITVNSPATVCAPLTVDVSGTASGAATYKYYTDNTGSVELSPTVISSVGTTNYWVIGTSAEGCVSEAVQGTVTINAKPIITVTSPAAVCAPLTVDIAGTASGTATYKYYADNGSGGVGSELSPTIISSVGTTNYWVIGTSAEGCVSEAVQGTVTIHAKPVITVTTPAAVCAPLTVDVAGTAMGAATYKYYTDNTGSVELSPTVISSVGTTNYWVIGTSAEGCVSDAVVGTVVINAKPVITVNSPTAVCAPLTVDVAGTATGAATYKYYTDNTGSVELSPTIISSVGTTNYWVIGKSAEGCVSEAVQGTVTINAKPVITVNSPAAVCAPLTVDVSGTATGAATYKYYADNGGDIGVELSPAIISSVGTTNYWVIGKSAEGCTSEAVMGTVTIHAKPVITVNSPATVCAPLTVDVSGTASGAATYKYYADNGGGVVGSELTSTIISSVGATNYWVIGTSAEGCTSEAVMGTVTINAKPVITVNSPAAVCVPLTVDVAGTATGASTYKYYTDNTGSVELSPTVISSVGTTNYWAIGKSAEGCASEAVQGTVTINAKPVIRVNSPAAVCAPLTVDVAGTATGAATYKYYTDNTGSVELSPTVISSVGTTNYWVIGTSAEGCSSDPVQGTVTINAKPVITVTSPTAVCAPLTVDIAGTASGAVTYKYYTDNTGSVELSPTVISSVGTTNYWVIGKSAEGCTSEAVMGTVTINAKPVIIINSPAAVCAPLTVDVSGTATGAATYKYYTDNTGSVELSPTIISSVGTTNYWVIGTSAQNCVSDPVMGTVTINATPTPTISGASTVWGNSSQTYNTETSMTTYLWTVTGGTITSGQNTSSVTISWNASGSGTVSVSSTNASGCTSTTPATMNVTILQANLSLTLSDTKVLEGGTAVTATVCLAEGVIAPAGGLVVNLNTTSTVANIEYSLTGTGISSSGFPASITIPEGERCVSFNILASADDVLEGTQTLDISASISGFTPDTKTLDIMDRTPGDIVVVAGGNASEPNTNSSFTIKFKADGVTCTQDVLVTYSLSGTAVEGTDYVSLAPHQVIIPAGSHSVLLPVTVLNNFIVDGSRTIKIKIESASKQP